MPPSRRTRTGRYRRRAYVGRRKAPFRARKTSRRLVNRTTKVPFPPVFFTRLNYSEQVKLINTGDAGPDIYNFTSNGLYDPNVTGTGGQPRYFDSLCGAKNGTAPYQQYTVYGCKVNVRFVNTSLVSAVGFVGFKDSNDNSPATLKEVRERPMYKSVMLGTSTTTGSKSITFYMNNRKIWGKPKTAISGETVYSANYNANPAVLGYIDIGSAPVDQASETAFDVLAEVKITYYCKFSQRNDVADS